MSTSSNVPFQQQTPQSAQPPQQQEQQQSSTAASSFVMQPSPLQRSSESGAISQRASSDANSTIPGGNKINSSGTASNSTSSNSSGKYDDQTQLVLDYLKEKGMNQAALELMQKIDSEKNKTAVNKDSNNDINKDSKEKSPRDRFMEEEEKMRAQRTLLSKTTGGGYGYDRDSAWPLIQWGIPDINALAALEGSNTQKTRPAPLGVEEAQAMVDAFVHFQLWVLNLPDHRPFACASSSTSNNHYDNNIILQSFANNPILRAQKSILENKDQPVSAIVEIMVSQPSPAVKGPEDANPSTSTTLPDDSIAAGAVGVVNLPASVKAEMLAVSFALFVHTYADLLEVGMESTATLLRDAFEPVYKPLYPHEFRDLMQCATTESMMRLNAHNSQHMEAVGNLKTILVQVASYQLRKEEYIVHLQTNLASTTANDNDLTPQQQEQQWANDPKVKDCDKKIQILQSKYREMSLRATQWFDKMLDVPFLRRARATRWIITISTSTYNMLASFLGSDDSLLSMSTLLQTKCTLQVERRDPLPYTPSCVLLEQQQSKEKGLDSVGFPLLAINNLTEGGAINWAVPAPQPEAKFEGEPIPFPKFHLQNEYETEEEASKDLLAVEFNRALLVHGFRRLEALERKREYEVLTPLAQKRARQGDSICNSRTLPNPLEPCILLSTLSASSAQLNPVLGNGTGGKTKNADSGPRAVVGTNCNSNIASVWEEPGVGICCGKVCRLGRSVAVGCDDAAVRVYDLENEGGEPSQVLMGHKNGFPVFDVAWNRDGRSLLSSGGDGSIRLWDTMAVGPFGETTTPKAALGAPSSSSLTSGAKSASGDTKRKGQAKPQQSKHQEDILNEMEMGVPGWRAGDPVAYTSGAAIAVYRGHAPNTPVWHVSFAPCGYYFCSAGADATARIWTTDRPVPVRLLSGHTSANINCADWHPNANYVVTGSDDRTARLWDVQTGQTVRILMGVNSGINTVRISPGGRYCAATDYSGLVHLWDLGSGRKISVFLSPQAFSGSLAVREKSMLHSLTFSACGQALAAGGDDCCVRIWDVQTAGADENEAVRKNAYSSIPTRRTVLLDLLYTKSNLLLAIGKYVSPVPLISPIFE